MSIKGELLYGIGLNDADYQVHGKRTKNNSIDWRCPYYIVWSNMLKRSYDTSTHKRQPTYNNVIVCKEWHVFSVFKKWMENQDWKNKSLDKDIIKLDNLIYSPDTCCFVEARINVLLIGSNKSRGEWPKGLTLKENNKFRVRCNLNGKTITLGTYSIKDFNAAVKAYCDYKSDCIKMEAEKQTDYRIKQGLFLHSKNEKDRYFYIIEKYKNKINKLINQ